MLGKNKKLLQQIEENNKRIENLKKENNILESLCKATSNMFWIKDLDNNLIYWTKGMEELTGLDKNRAKEELNENLKDKNGVDLSNLINTSKLYDNNGNEVGILNEIRESINLDGIIDIVENNSSKIDGFSSHIKMSMKNISEVSNKIKTQSNDILEESKSGLKTAQKVYEQTESCTKFGHEVKENIESINISMKKSVDKINDLKSKSELIVDILTTIQGIASQTNLLALNASIEAARAGESGRGFAVVAEEIRKLAEVSQESTKEIKETIDAIIDIVQSTVEFIEKTDTDLLAGANGVNKLLELIKGIENASEIMLNSMEKIEKVSIESSKINIDQNNSLTEIAAVSEEFNNMSRDIGENIKNEILNIPQ